jgi:Helix-turn-helix domain
MSKARLIITAVTVEGRSQHEVARVYGINQSWVSRLVARYRAEGEAAFQPRSRRPKTSPTAIGLATVTLITEFATSSPARAWTPDPTPSPGTSPTTTAPASRWLLSAAT